MTTIPPKKTFISGIDQVLLERARSEVTTASTEKDPWLHGGHAIAAIILAVAGLEAHVGEWLARPANHSPFPKAQLDEFRTMPAYEVIKAIIKQRDVNYKFSEAQWYLRLNGLHQLRNHVVHYNPEKRDTGTFPERLDPYIRNRTFVPKGDTSMDWTSRLLVHAVAKQALGIAVEAVAQFDKVVPNASA